MADEDNSDADKVQARVRHAFEILPQVSEGGVPVGAIVIGCYLHPVHGEVFASAYHGDLPSTNQVLGAMLRTMVHIIMTSDYGLETTSGVNDG